MSAFIERITGSQVGGATERSIRLSLSIITRVAPYRHWMEKANKKHTILSSKPLGVTA